MHQRPAAAKRLHHRSKGREICRTGRLPFDRDVEELEPLVSHNIFLMSDCLSVVGKCQKNDPVEAGRCDQCRLTLSGLTRGGQRRGVIYAV